MQMQGEEILEQTFRGTTGGLNKLFRKLEMVM